MRRMPLPASAKVRLGANVIAARGERKRSEIAAALGSSRESVAQVERGQRDISIDWIVRLAKVLGTTATALLNGVRLIDEKKR